MRRPEIEALLPGVFQRTVADGTPLVPILDAMEGLHAPSEDVLQHLDAFFDPRRTPDTFVPLLARWVDLDWLMVEHPEDPFPGDFSPLVTGTGRLRELIATVVRLSAWRGTTTGLAQFLYIATGTDGFEIEESPPGDDGAPIPFHIRVHAPAATEPYAPLIHRIVDTQRPAYVTFDIRFGDTSIDDAHLEEEHDG
jgi:phage tail-like protein